MKVVVAPDSYKGSLPAKEVGLIIKNAFELEMPEAEVVTVPMADGGEGTLDALIFATKGEKIETTATGPLGKQVATSYGILGDGETAVIEMAQVAGLPMVPGDKRNPEQTTTFGVGELMVAALEKGVRSFIIGLGEAPQTMGGLACCKPLERLS